MTRLPVIVGFGGIGPAGRSSFHHAYHRTIWESLDSKRRRTTVAATAAMMNLAFERAGVFYGADGSQLDESLYPDLERQVLEGTLIRQLETERFDPNKVPGNVPLNLSGGENKALTIRVNTTELPSSLPEAWRTKPAPNGQVAIEIPCDSQLWVETRRSLTVQSAGQLPKGFDPAGLYNSRFHPRGLQLVIIGASDAVRSMGIEWSTILKYVRPDEIAVYAASAMAQLDQNGTGGMLQARLRGNRVSSKQLPLGLNTMPADFVNAYILGSVGTTGANAGACATFLYNLRLAVEDIQSGRRRVAVVGNGEAPLIPEVIEGYAAMSALATDENLCKLDGRDTPDYRRASRPFGENCGFTLGESGQYFILLDDELAVHFGAQIHGAVTDVFVSADGYKKSISAPGPGNYITMGKSVDAARALLGETIVRNHSFIQAHGSSTPQNRTTETRILDSIAKAFHIENWPVTAVKAFVGHSLAPASADQLTNALGVLRHGIMPGIKTIERLAEDLYDDHLDIALVDTELNGRAQVAFLNSKGFGGNNATGTILSPSIVERMLEKRHGKKAMTACRVKRETVESIASTYDEQCCAEPMRPIYSFGEALVDENAIEINDHEITVPGYDLGVELQAKNRYPDMI